MLDPPEGVFLKVISKSPEISSELKVPTGENVTD